MSAAGTLHGALDRLIERHAAGASAADLEAARARFDERRGKVFQDEELWEVTSRCFVEWFVLEPQVPGERALAARDLDTDLDADEREAILALLRSLRSLYRLEGQDGGRVVVTDLIGGAELLVCEPRTLVGVVRGDVFEARIAARGDDLYFTPAFLFHPPDAGAAIEEHIRAIVSAGGTRADAVDACAALRVRCERSGRVAPARVYEQALPSKR